MKICVVSGKTVPLHTQIRNEARLYSEYRGVEQLVARQAHNLEVACSSPASATFYWQPAEYQQVFLFVKTSRVVGKVGRTLL